MAISSDDKAAIATLETVKYVRQIKKGNTILGVSNISFGLPLREIVTSTFFTMAMQNGLSAAIMNPNSMEMMKAWTCFCTLSGYDQQCQNYISFAEKYSEFQSQNVPSADKKIPASESKNAGEEIAGLKYAIVKGMKDRSRSEAELLLESEDSMNVINGHIIPALDIVGKGFEEKRVYLPQLLMSAEAAGASFDEVRAKMPPDRDSSKGGIVLATVKGDIHDIGKNIVKVLLENYSFRVIDLGKDVPPEKIVETVVGEKIRLVGLSALMTTTVPAMEETIRQLREKAPWCRVCVGGAVLTQEYADMIGADFYGKDAMETVKFAQKVFSHED